MGHMDLVDNTEIERLIHELVTRARSGPRERSATRPDSVTPCTLNRWIESRASAVWTIEQVMGTATDVGVARRDRVSPP